VQRLLEDERPARDRAPLGGGGLLSGTRSSANEHNEALLVVGVSLPSETDA